jgi:hypothetical protein
MVVVNYNRTASSFLFYIDIDSSFPADKLVWRLSRKLDKFIDESITKVFLTCICIYPDNKNRDINYSGNKHMKVKPLHWKIIIILVLNSCCELHRGSACFLLMLGHLLFHSFCTWHGGSIGVPYAVRLFSLILNFRLTHHRSPPRGAPSIPEQEKGRGDG